jgi:AGZA family xanthine/uracil permease-like MFS transporter
MSTPLASKYSWAKTGDINAFFGLMIDNVTVMAIMTAILTTVFHFPAEFIYTHMIPGTAFGVLVGDLIYTWMAFQLAKKKLALGQPADVTAMPLGLDTPSTIGITLSVLGPAYLQFHDPMKAWEIGMAVMVCMGILKVICAFFGEVVQKAVPQAGLLGSLAGIGIALIGFLPLSQDIFRIPLVGMISLGIVLYALVGKFRLPWNFPGVLAGALVGIFLYYLLGHWGVHGLALQPIHWQLQPALPFPTLGFAYGFKEALQYLPVAIPFGLLTVVGGINVTESARVAGDDYNTRDILLAEAFATLVAGVCGGVAQSTPYIGHPAYKNMGGRSAYTLATALFVGFGGILGYLSFFLNIVPVAAIAPILVFVGLDITSQAYHACPKRHAEAVSFAYLPILADLVFIELDQVVNGVFINGRPVLAYLPPDVLNNFETIKALGHGFIITGMLWGAILAFIIDKELRKAAFYLLISAVCSFFGIIHSVKEFGDIYLPWKIGSPIPYDYTIGYLMIALFLLLISFTNPQKEEEGILAYDRE